MNAKLIFLGLGLSLLTTSFWVKGDAFDIQLYDTYFVIGWGVLLKSVGVFLCLVYGVYFLLNRYVRQRQ